MTLFLNANVGRMKWWKEEEVGLPKHKMRRLFAIKQQRERDEKIGNNNFACAQFENVIIWNSLCHAFVSTISNGSYNWVLETVYFLSNIITSLCLCFSRRTWCGNYVSIWERSDKMASISFLLPRAFLCFTKSVCCRYAWL